MKTAGITDRTDRTDHDTAADRTPDRPRHVPAKNWLQAVEHVQTHAKSFPCYWPLWCHVWRKHLRRIEDGARGDVFNRLFNEYEQAGGRGSAFEPAPTAGPDVARGVRPETAAMVTASSEPVRVERR